MDKDLVYIYPRLLSWHKHIEIYALGMEGDKINRDWRVAKPVGDHTAGFLIAYDNLEEYYECHDEPPIVLIRRAVEEEENETDTQG